MPNRRFQLPELRLPDEQNKTVEDDVYKCKRMVLQSRDGHLDQGEPIGSGSWEAMGLCGARRRSPWPASEGPIGRATILPRAGGSQFCSARCPAIKVATGVRSHLMKPSNRQPSFAARSGL